MILERYLSLKRAATVNKLISPGHRSGRILDIGCGEHPGFLISTDFNEKYGIDRLVKDEVPDNAGKWKIFIKNCDIQKDGMGSFPDGYFDVVTMLAVIEHLDPQGLPAMIKEINRVLKTSGIFILTTPAPWANFIMQVLSKLKLINTQLFEEHKMLYHNSDLLSVLTKGGFQKENIKFGKFEIFINTWSSAVKT